MVLKKSTMIFSNSRKTTVLKSMLLLVSFLIIFTLTNCSGNKKLKDGGLRIGWAMEDITPEGPASLSGQYYALMK